MAKAEVNRYLSWNVDLDKSTRLVGLTNEGPDFEREQQEN